MRDLAVLIPTRGRPHNIRKVIAAWDFTNAWDVADMVLIADADDSEIGGYRAIVVERFNDQAPEGSPALGLVEVEAWMPMVHKLNAVAREAASGGTLFFPDRYFALGFAGDDHLPRTINWARRYLTVLRELGTGMVYGDDGYHGAKLSTEWAVTSDTVAVLGRMVPADVEHLYCDNAMMDLFGGAGAMRHLPEVRIEHINPYAGGKGEMDAQYKRVNHRDQYKKDGRAYQAWKSTALGPDVVRIRNLRKGRPDVVSDKNLDRAQRVIGSGPRPTQSRRGQVQRSGPRSRRSLKVPRHFGNVRAATPEDVMVALADLASQVPAGQEIVELGVFQGRTALQLAWGAEHGNGNHVTAIDPWDLEGNVYDPPFTDPGSRTQAFLNIESLGYADKIDLVWSFSQDIAENWASYNRPPVGLLYVDGDHTEEGARRDIEAWAPHLAEGAVIAVDDYGHPDWPGVGQAVDALVAEGFLAPIELYHDRLAVTRLTSFPTVPCAGCDDKSPHDAHLVKTPYVATESSVLQPTAITSEGVTPSPYPAVEGQVAEPVNTESGPPEGWVKDGQGRWSDPGQTGILPEVDPASYAPDAVDLLFDGPDPDMSTHPSIDRYREVVNAGELEDITNGTPIEDLNLVNLKALAKSRSIVLGARKDKRAEIIQALKDGK